MTLWQKIVTVGLCALGTQLTRWLPFLAFSRSTPRSVRYLGKALPLAVFALLVVYCFKDVPVLTGSHGIPELIAAGVTAGTHLWRGQMLLSIAAGTVCYMVLVQTVF